MDAFIQDIRSGIRQLSRQRGSSVTAILTLALGIGASSAIFSVIDATILRPLPYPEPEQLVTIGIEEHQPDGEVVHPTTSMADMRAWQAADDVVSTVAAWGTAFRGRIADGPQPERLEVLQFTEDYLPLHGVTPLLGRDFTREDSDPGSPLVALLGYGYWQSRFGGRTDVLGEAIRLDSDVATIIGVLPSSFNATTPLSTPLRIPENEFARRGTGRVSVYGRLRSGVTIEQARERLSVAMTGPLPLGVRGARAHVTSRLESTITGYRTTINVLSAAVSLILLIAAVNVAGLLLARGAVRESELAVRGALGAGRGRLMRQLLVESVVLALPAGVIGVILAWLFLDGIVANIPMSLPANAPISINLTVLAWTTSLLLLTAVLCGLLPAIRLSRVHLVTALNRGGRHLGPSLSRRGGQMLMAAEIALAVILVTGAALMIRSFARISAVDLGFTANGLMTMELLPLEIPPQAHKDYYAALLQQIRTMPDVSAAGLVDSFPLAGGSSFSTIVVAGQSTGVGVVHTIPDYFSTIGARLTEGRWPTPADDAAGLRLAVINESARPLFSAGRAVGQVFTRGAKDTQPWTVVGVIADLRHGGPLNTRNLRRPQVFFPYQPNIESRLIAPMMIVMRVTSNQTDFAERLRTTAHSIGPRVLVERIQSADEWFDDRVITPRRRTVLLTLLGGLGLTLALVGVFAMTAYAVTRRTAEIGVRMAFGARPAQVVRTMVRESAIPIAVGTVIGLGGAMLSTRAIASFLFETAPTDPMTLAVVAITLAATGCVAALLPALRASKVDPASCLRAE